MRKRWPEEVIEWLRQNAEGHSTAELTRMINETDLAERYGLVFTEKILHSAKSRYKIKSGNYVRAKHYKFPPEVRAYIKEVNPGRRASDVAQLVNERFGDGTCTVDQIRAYKKNNRLPSGYDAKFKKGQPSAFKGTRRPTRGRQGETQFKKGHIPANHVPVGTISKGSGYWKEKIAEPDVWRMCHHLEWEKYHGPIPEGCNITFLDGNRDHYNIENLKCISKRVNAEVNRAGMRFDSPDLTETGCNIAELRLAMLDKRKGNKKDE